MKIVFIILCNNVEATCLYSNKQQHVKTSTFNSYERIFSSSFKRLAGIMLSSNVFAINS